MYPITVVTTVFNGEDTIKKAVDSILTQTFPLFEYIIVNDGSTDKTKDILNKMEDPRIKIIHIEKNQGAAICLNHAIGKASGNWIAVQDADDISLPTRLKEQYHFLKQNNQLQLIGSYITCFSLTKNSSLNRMKKQMEQLINVNNSLFTGKFLFYGMPYCHGTFMFSRKTFHELGGYSTDFQVGYDYDLLVKFFNHSYIKKVPKILYQYRLSPHSLAYRDLYQTNLESIEISIRGIIEHTHQDKNLIIAGTKKACTNFKEHIQPRIHRENIVYVDPFLAFQSQWIEAEKPSTIVILDYSGSLPLINKLEEEGLILNHDYFVTWNLTN
ncbi:MAG: glycosyltransferase [Bacillota bacterium]|nr:glycosyltransferase [Bacillota bacterium]